MSVAIDLPKLWLVPQSDFYDWLDGIAARRTLIAPRQESGLVLYRRVKNSQEIAKNIIRPILSLKEIFLPPTERLFTIKKTGQELCLEETLPEESLIVFGVRPCDAHAVRILDAAFLDTGSVDSYYARRRENTTLIGMACEEMGETCFCTSVGVQPQNGCDMDIMVREISEAYLVEAITEKGYLLLQHNKWQTTKKDYLVTPIESSFNVPEQATWHEHFNDDYWSKISERCLSCRACAYVCPTCRCFIVRDEMVRPGEFERIRCWDACTGENYRRLAGGNKQRTGKDERLRNRIFCKFDYFPRQYNLGIASACTGCGRCTEVCPVGVDITEVLVDLEKLA